MDMAIKIGRGKLAEFSLGVVCQKEGTIFVSYIPALDLTTHGDSLDDALRAASEVATVFIEELISMNTVEEVLTELGWEKSPGDNGPFPYVPPELVSLSHQKIKVECHA